MPSFPIHVMQDGADFHAYRDHKFEELIPSLNRTAPFKVLDGDIEAATRARVWFTQLCSHNQVIHWHNMFGEW